MSEIPTELRYTASHEWLRLESGTIVIGITDYAQQSLGDITFVQLPRAGETLGVGAAFGVVESVKAASDLYAPVSGTVTEVNPVLAQTPEILNRDPYGTGWLLRVSPSAAPSATMDADEYRRTVE